MSLAEGAKLEMCCLLHHLSGVQLRHRVEAIVNFSHDFVGEIQTDQLRRYIEIKQSDLPSAIAAKRTREFRCPPREQMNGILGFKNLEDDERENCPCTDELAAFLSQFHQDFVGKIVMKAAGDEDIPDEPPSRDEVRTGLVNRMMNVITLAKKAEEEQAETSAGKSPEEIFRKVLITTIVRWAKESVRIH